MSSRVCDTGLLLERARRCDSCSRSLKMSVVYINPPAPSKKSQLENDRGESTTSDVATASAVVAATNSGRCVRTPHASTWCLSESALNHFLDEFGLLFVAG